MTSRARNIADAEQRFVNTAGDTMTGGLTLGGALNLGSVGQIVFPATQNASANANTLDDYEEGTFSPTIQIGGATPSGVSYFNAVGQYTKVGRVVTCIWGIGANWSSSNGGAITLHNLPFGGNDSGGYREPGMSIGSTNWGGNILRIAMAGAPGATFVYVYKGANGLPLLGSDVGTQFWMHGTLVYYASA